MTENPEHGLKALVQTTCSTHTPANKAALKALAIAKGGITVVPKIFSGEVMEKCLISVVSMSSLRSVWALLRSKVQNEGKQYGSWRHKLKAGMSMFRQAQHDTRCC